MQVSSILGLSSKIETPYLEDNLRDLLLFQSNYSYSLPTQVSCLEKQEKKIGGWAQRGGPALNSAAAAASKKSEGILHREFSLWVPNQGQLGRISLLCEYLRRVLGKCLS